MKRRRVWPIVVSVLAVLSLAAIAFVALSSDNTPDYSTVKASKQTVEVSVAANGKLLDEVSYSLAAGIDPVVSSTALVQPLAPMVITGQPGFTVKKILVEPGDQVKKKQKLIRLENPVGQKVFLKAPVKGTIRTISAVVNSPASGELILLGSGKLLSVVKVSEYDVAELSLGQRALVNIDALGKEFEATVLEIGQQADGSSGVQRYSVLLEIDSLPESARTGMSTNAKIIVQSLADVLSIPANAIENIDGKNVVARIGATGQVEPLEVTVGVVGDTLVEILSGLNAGDEVVVGKIGDIPEVNTQFGPPPGVRSNTGGN